MSTKVLHQFDRETSVDPWAHNIISENGVIYITVRGMTAESINSHTARSIADSARKADNLYTSYGIEPFGSPYPITMAGEMLNPFEIPKEAKYFYERKFKINQGI